MKKVFKIVFAGDGAVGKTTIISYLLDKDDAIEMTRGVSIETLKIESFDDEEVEAATWDIGGQKQFRFLVENLIGGTNLAVFVFDLTRYKSLINLENDWIPRFEKTNSKPALQKYILIGNKSDLGQTIKDDEIQRIREKFDLSYIKVSAKTGNNMDDLLELLIEESEEIISSFE